MKNRGESRGEGGKPQPRMPTGQHFLRDRVHAQGRQSRRPMHGPTTASAERASPCCQPQQRLGWFMPHDTVRQSMQNAPNDQTSVALESMPFCTISGGMWVTAGAAVGTSQS